VRQAGISFFSTHSYGYVSPKELHLESQAQTNHLNINYLITSSFVLYVNYIFFAASNKKQIMSENQEDLNYGSKGACFGKFLLFFALFIILLIWIYQKNGDFLN